MVKQPKRIAPWQVKKILARGQMWRGDFFHVKTFLALTSAPRAYRLAVVISKKTLAKAHDRNLCRRRVKAAFRECEGRADSYDLIVFPNKRAIDCEFSLLKEEAKKCLDALQSKR